MFSGWFSSPPVGPQGRHPILCNYNQGSTRWILTSYHRLVLPLFVFQRFWTLSMTRVLLKSLIMLIIVIPNTYLSRWLQLTHLLVVRWILLLLLLNTVEFFKFLLQSVLPLIVLSLNRYLTVLPDRFPLIYVVSKLTAGYLIKTSSSTLIIWYDSPTTDSLLHAPPDTSIKYLPVNIRQL